MSTGLVERLEAAEVGSRELDFWIAYELGQLSDVVTKRPAYVREGDGEVALFDSAGRGLGWVGYHVSRPVTASVDAALALASKSLPGWEVSLAQRVPRYDETCAEWWHASLFRMRSGVSFGGDGTVSVKGPTAPLALCAATLRALRALHPDGIGAET